MTDRFFHVSHPDLIDLDRRLGSRLERILAAEHEAAATIARRSTTLHERLIELEDQEASVRVSCDGGIERTGRLVVVGAEHIELRTDRWARSLIPLASILMVEVV
jgi:hypothetical protein